MNFLIVLLCTDLFCGVAPAWGADAPKESSVMEFGARADGIADDGPAIQAALAKAMSLGDGAKLFVPAGTYKISHSIEIAGAKKLTIEGTPKTLIVMDNIDAAMIRIHGSENLTLRQLTFDRHPLHQNQGTIDAVDIGAMTCDVTLDPCYDGFDAPQFAKGGTFGPFLFPESGTYQLDQYLPTYVSASALGNYRWKVLFKGKTPRAEWAGKRFAFWTGGRGHCVEADGLRNALFQDLRYSGGAAAGLYLVGLDGTITFDRFIIGAPEGSGRLFAECGGGQISNIRGQLIFKHCDFSKIDDDGLDILGNWCRVIEQIDPRTLHLQSDLAIRPGDHIQLWDWSLKASRTDAIVKQVAAEPDRSIRVTLDRDVTTLRVGAGIGRPFGREAQADGIDRVIDLDTVGTQTLIQDCNFQVFRAKCLNLKANHCLVQNCHFSDSFQPAISAAPEWYFEEGPPVRRLVIRNNTFSTCNHSNIEIGADIVPPNSPSRDSIDVVIEGNHFDNYGASASVFPNYPIGNAIRVQNAKDVVIRDNDFGQPAASAPHTAKLIIKNSTHVVIDRNVHLEKANIEETNVSP